MSRRIKFRWEAERDVDEIYAWYESRQVGLGERFLALMDDTTSRIEDHPFSYAEVEEEVRRALLHQFPYGVFYVVEKDLVTVLAVFHARRDPDAWKERL